MKPIDALEFRSFQEFYPYYLTQHRDRRCRRMHFIGSTSAFVGLCTAVFTLNPLWLVAGISSGYAFAWTGHFCFERNRPAAFQNAVWSFAGDWVMYTQMLRGKISF